MDTLLLNANGMPLSEIPLSVISWEKAMYAIYMGKANVLKEYDYWTVRTQHLEIKVPSIIIMKKQVKWEKQLKYSRNNVFIRDDFTCQLQTTNSCRQRQGKARVTELTIDHVIPKSKGGKTNWLNVCTSCKDCNAAKGNDETVVPRRMPTKPSYYDILKKRKSLPIHIRDADWAHYISWPPELIRVLPQPGPRG